MASSLERVERAAVGFSLERVERTAVASSLEWVERTSEVAWLCGSKGSLVQQGQQMASSGNYGIRAVGLRPCWARGRGNLASGCPASCKTGNAVRANYNYLKR